MFMRHTEPCPVFPSNTKKFAMGRSRAPSIFRMSWARMPPTMAHTGANSWAATVTIVLFTEKVYRYALQIQSLQKKTYSMRSFGTDLMTLFTSAALNIALAIDSSSAQWLILSGNVLLCRDWNSHSAFTTIISKQK